MSETKKALQDVAKILENAGWNQGPSFQPSRVTEQTALTSSRSSWIVPALTTAIVLGLATLLTVSFFFRTPR